MQGWIAGGITAEGAATALGGAIDGMLAESLAALETFVHLTAVDARIAFAAIEVRSPDDAGVSSIDQNALPSNWREEPPPEETKALGTAWVHRGDSLLLRVPSVIVPREWNYVLNRQHPQFSLLEILAPEPFGL